MKYRESVERVPLDVKNSRDEFRAWLDERNVMFWTLVTCDSMAGVAVIRMYHYPPRPGSEPTRSC